MEPPVSPNKPKGMNQDFHGMPEVPKNNMFDFDTEKIDSLIKRLNQGETFDQKVLQDVKLRIENITWHKFENNDLDWCKFLVRYAAITNSLKKLKSALIWSAICVFFYGI